MSIEQEKKRSRTRIVTLWDPSPGADTRIAAAELRGQEPLNEIERLCAEHSAGPTRAGLLEFLGDAAAPSSPDAFSGLIVANDAAFGFPVGILLARQTFETVDLDFLTVARELRRAGVAHELMIALFGACLKTGGRRVLLEVASHNTPARALYKKLGFAEISRRSGYYKDGDDALILERQL